MTPDRAEAYASWFACLADPVRVRLLHAVAVADQPLTLAQLTARLGTSTSDCSAHVAVLAGGGFVVVERDGDATLVSPNPACRTGRPHVADVVLGLDPPRRPGHDELPDGVTLRPLAARDWAAVRGIYAEGIATGQATFETQVPEQDDLEAGWLPQHRWVAEVDGRVAGWAAAKPVSTRPVYAGVAETSVYVGEGHRGRGVGRALLHRQVTAADAGGLWTLQTSIFPENRASLNLHHAAGFRTLAVRERIGRHHGVWRDTVFLERRRP